MLAAGEELFPGIIGYDETVIPEINLGLIAGHDLLFSAPRVRARAADAAVSRFLDQEIPYFDIPGGPVDEDPCHPITQTGGMVAARAPAEVPVAGWRGSSATPSGWRRGRSLPT